MPVRTSSSSSPTRDPSDLSVNVISQNMGLSVCITLCDQHDKMATLGKDLSSIFFLGLRIGFFFFLDAFFWLGVYSEL